MELWDASPEARFPSFFAGYLRRQPSGYLAELGNAYLSVRRPASGTAATSGRRLCTKCRTAPSTRMKSSRYGQLLEK